MRLLLVRHGETAWNQAKILQGQIDEPLAPEGMAQARALAPFFANGAAPDLVVSSDLSRATMTASLLGFPNAVLDRRLREIDVGAWGGRPIAALSALDGDLYGRWRRGDYTPENGEKWSNFTKRVAEALADAVASGHERVLIVAHGGVIRAACEILVSLTPSKLAATAPATVASFTVMRDGTLQTARLEGYNIGPSSSIFDAPD
jgi:probable phosphoglycerate mutase